MMSSIKSYVLLDPNMFKRMRATQAEFELPAKMTSVDRALQQDKIIHN